MGRKIGLVACSKTKQGKLYKERWARTVVSKLRQKGVDSKNDEFYIFGGKSY